MGIITRNLAWFSPEFKNFINNITKLVIQIGRHLVSWKADKWHEIPFVQLFIYTSFIKHFRHLITA